MTPTELDRYGRALTGKLRWRRELARMLGVNSRLVRRWAAGHEPVPEWATERLDEMARGRAGRLGLMSDEVFEATLRRLYRDEEWT